MACPVGLALVTGLLFISIFWIRRKLIRSNESSPNPPPGPWKLPFIGNIHQLVHPLFHHRLRDLAKKFGPVMQLQIGEVVTVIISSEEAAKEVLKTQEINFVDRPHPLAASILFYNRKGFGFAPYGDYWRELRKISNTRDAFCQTCTIIQIDQGRRGTWRFEYGRCIPFLQILSHGQSGQVQTRKNA